jgi:hypothetical protein
MDTLTTPVLLRCMVTYSRRVSVSIVAGSVKESKTIHEVAHAVPAGSQANMDLWYSTLGLYQPKQQKYHTKIPE